jgi:two-component system, LytTR family, sensor histidine kinase AlgZ
MAVSAMDRFARRAAPLHMLAWLAAGIAIGCACAALAPAPLVNALLFAVPGTLVYGVAAGISAAWLCRADPAGSRPAALLLVLCAAAVLAACLWVAVLGGWNELCLAFGAPWAGIAQTPQLSAFLFAVGALAYAVLAAPRCLGSGPAPVRAGPQAQLMAQDADLRMLRTRVDPHLLSASLDSVDALTAQDPKCAREMAQRFAGYFRRSLGLAAQPRITLAQEMDLVRDFLAIEKVRFGERLVTEEALEKGALECLVPPMIIQPLVENAIEHGVGRLTEGGLVLVAAWRDGGRLSITVSNAIDPEAPEGGRAGAGLANLRQRLACAYPDQAALECKREGDTFSVELRLPAQTGRNAAS